MSRLYALDKNTNQYFDPTTFYERVANNPNVKPRLKKKAECIIGDWAYLSSLGYFNTENLESEVPSFVQWRKHCREVEKLNLGIQLRYKHRGGLKEAFNKAVAYCRYCASL